MAGWQDGETGGRWGAWLQVHTGLMVTQRKVWPGKRLPHIVDLPDVCVVCSYLSDAVMCPNIGQNTPSVNS